MPYHITLNDKPLDEKRMKDIPTFDKALKMVKIGQNSSRYRWGKWDAVETKPKKK